MMRKTYTLKKEKKEWIARSIKYPTVIGVGNTKDEAIKELNIFINMLEEK